VRPRKISRVLTFETLSTIRSPRACITIENSCFLELVITQTEKRDMCRVRDLIRGDWWMLVDRLRKGTVLLGIFQELGRSHLEPMGGSRMEGEDVVINMGISILLI
jgi:hypothetical protein